LPSRPFEQSRTLNSCLWIMVFWLNPI
jgi:hypothetical protein